MTEVSRGEGGVGGRREVWRAQKGMDGEDLALTAPSWPGLETV